MNAVVNPYHKLKQCLSFNHLLVLKHFVHVRHLPLSYITSAVLHVHSPLERRILVLIIIQQQQGHTRTKTTCQICFPSEEVGNHLNPQSRTFSQYFIKAYCLTIQTQHFRVTEIYKLIKTTYICSQKRKTSANSHNLCTTYISYQILVPNKIYTKKEQSERKAFKIDIYNISYISYQVKKFLSVQIAVSLQKHKNL